MAHGRGKKAALYADLFRARTDVYALYWENLGGHERVDACCGGPVAQGNDRRSVRFPLTRAVIAAHLAENDVFIGLYPLTKDNSCRFSLRLRRSTAMIDAGYVKAARLTVFRRR